MLVTEDRFSYYRKSAGSLSSAANDRRMHSERLWVYRHLFDDIPDSGVADLFSSGFGSWQGTPQWLRLALIYLCHADPMIYQVGCEILLDRLSDPGSIDVLRSAGVTLQDVFGWTGRADANGGQVQRDLIAQILEARIGCTKP